MSTHQIVEVPVMPRGVEHIRGASLILEGPEVEVPVMPRGVEHKPPPPRVGGKFAKWKYQ